MREKKRERVKIIFPDRFVCLLSFKLFIVHRFYLNWTFLKAKAFVYNALYKIVYLKSYQRSQDLYNSCYHPQKKLPSVSLFEVFKQAIWVCFLSPPPSFSPSEVKRRSSNQFVCFDLSNSGLTGLKKNKKFSFPLQKPLESYKF